MKNGVTSQHSLRRVAGYMVHHWILVFAFLFGLYNLLPFIAPVFFHLGLVLPGQILYFIYSFFCHQLPERSFFFFGSQAMYSLTELHAAGQDISNPMVLRRFIGSPEMGWKVAWSDRMVSMYGAVWLFGILWPRFRHILPPLPWWGFCLLLLPMGMDGGTHFISDLFGHGQGFRAENLWLAELTQHAFPISFYAGDALGSFNSWMRFVTGILFGLAVIWFGFPHIHHAMQEFATWLNQELDPQGRKIPTENQ
jgi:uncharacterized membrane protein